MGWKQGVRCRISTQTMHSFKGNSISSLGLGKFDSWKIPPPNCFSGCRNHQVWLGWSNPWGLGLFFLSRGHSWLMMDSFKITCWHQVWFPPHQKWLTSLINWSHDLSIYAGVFFRTELQTWTPVWWMVNRWVARISMFGKTFLGSKS